MCYMSKVEQSHGLHRFQFQQGHFYFNFKTHFQRHIAQVYSFSSSYPIHTDGVSASSIFSSIRNTCRKETWKSRYNTLQRKMGPHTEIDLVFQCFIQYFFVYELRDFIEKEMNWNSNSAVITKFVLVQVQEKEVISSRK